MISRTVLESNSCTLRRAGLAALLVFMVLLATAGVPSLALGATRYAATPGSGLGRVHCDCALQPRVRAHGGGVSDGDTVSLEPGSYPPVFGDLQTAARLSILGLGAHPGDTVVNVVGNFEVQNLSSTISNLSLNVVQGSLGFLFVGSLADRLLVNSTGSGGILRSCSIFHGELRDSVCTAVGGARSPSYVTRHITAATLRARVRAGRARRDCRNSIIAAAEHAVRDDACRLAA